MATQTLLTVDLRREDDVVLARQRARQLAAEFKLDPQDQIRFATAVSEIVRNAFNSAYLGNPVSNIANASFGDIQGQATPVRSGPRNLQLSLKYIF